MSLLLANFKHSEEGFYGISVLMNVNLIPQLQKICHRRDT